MSIGYPLLLCLPRSAAAAAAFCAVPPPRPGISDQVSSMSHSSPNTQRSAESLPLIMSHSKSFH